LLNTDELLRKVSNPSSYSTKRVKIKLSRSGTSCTIVFFWQIISPNAPVIRNMSKFGMIVAIGCVISLTNDITSGACKNVKIPILTSEVLSMRFFIIEGLSSSSEISKSRSRTIKIIKWRIG
jgi:hypothetical protein